MEGLVWADCLLHSAETMYSRPLRVWSVLNGRLESGFIQEEEA